VRGVGGVAALLLVGTLWAVPAFAACDVTTNGSAADTQTKLQAASAGQTVCLPAGSFTWTTQVVPTLAPNVTLQGATVCTGAAATLTCTDTTIITDSYDRSGSDPAILTITVPATGTFRLTGITWRQTSASSNGHIRAGSSGGTLRMDHNHFDHLSSVAWALTNISGVADHNRYDQSSGSADNSTRPMGTNDDTEWTKATAFGTATAPWFYVEDSYFANGIMNDCFSSGKQVFRYNYSTNSGLQQHGTGHAGENRGCRAMEVYGNSINGGASHTTAFGYYAGSAMIWGNSTSGDDSFVQLTSVRFSNFTYVQSPTPTDHGYCGTTFTGVGSVWDGNRDSTGYPCLDQVGRGPGDLLSSAFPTLTNSTRGCVVNFTWANRGASCDGSDSSAWPRQALEPAYEWSNTGTILGGAWMNVFTGPITANVDYYAEHGNSGCDPNASACTTGVGVGTLAQRPASCTTSTESGGGVGWWATDQGGHWKTDSGNSNDGALYKCTATNTWTLYYTPYTYPHPLSGAAVTPPAGGRLRFRVRDIPPPAPQEVTWLDAR
jgi:hypothetical protein